MYASSDFSAVSLTATCLGAGKRLDLAAQAASPWLGSRGRFFFRCTSSSEIAAGVTPDMRAACPSVAGR